jgi:hypothetical protein
MSLSGKGGATTIVKITGAGDSVACNTVNGGMNRGSVPIGNGGAITAYLNGYPPGTYVVTVKWTVNMTTTTAGGGGSVCIYVRSRNGLTSAGSPVLLNAGPTLPLSQSSTQTIIVTVRPGEAKVPVISVQPTIRASRSSACSTSYRGDLAVVSVKPLHPKQTKE